MDQTIARLDADREVNDRLLAMRAWIDHALAGECSPGDALDANHELSIATWTFLR